MSLNFNFEKMIERLGREEFDRITDHPSEEGKWHPVTNTLIWACLSVGLSGISEKNADKFAERYAALQSLSGGDILSEKEGRFYVTSEDVRRHIGLQTNVSNESDAAFAKKLLRIASDTGRSGMRLQDESAYDICARLCKS